MVFFVLRTGCQLCALGSDYPPKSTCYYWFRKLIDKGIFSLLFDELIGLLEEMKKINLEEAYIDATFVWLKSGKQLVGNTKCGKGHKLMAICDDKSRPLALLLESASRSEIKLVFDTLDCLATTQKPQRIIADRAYDSDKHDAERSRQGIDLIAPNRSNRKQNFQDKRPLRRYKRRHKIKNFFAHIHNYKRTIIFYDKILLYIFWPRPFRIYSSHSQ